MLTPTDLIQDELVREFPSAANILARLDAGGYTVMQKRQWPHHAVTEVHRDGEMRAM